MMDRNIAAPSLLNLLNVPLVYLQDSADDGGRDCTGLLGAGIAGEYCSFQSIATNAVHRTFASLDIPSRTLDFRGWRIRVHN